MKSLLKLHFQIYTSYAFSQNIYFRNIHTKKCNIPHLKKIYHKKTREIKKYGFIHDFLSLLNHNKFGKGITSKLDFCVFHHHKFKCNAEQILGPPKQSSSDSNSFQLLQIITFYERARLGGPSNCSNKTLFEMN